MKDEQVIRPPLDPEALFLEIEEVFTFNPPLTPEQQQACQIISQSCKNLAQGIAKLVPEGKEQTVAINNLLATALWARHGITRRQVTVGAVPWTEENTPQVPTISLEGQPTLAQEMEALRTAGKSAAT
jgi:wyosine [tRNA(Phe)-imidazoG37] synthetase (radical SAM superfamily)